MPRQRGGGRAPSRPAPAPARQNVTPPQPQRRPASTVAHPPAKQQAQPPAQAQQQQSPGLFGQMASTAAGVAVGSSIGHAIGGFFGGGSSAPAEAQQDTNMIGSEQQSTNAYGDSSFGAASCEGDARQFTKCLDENGGNMQICSWYLEQLKACQSAARQY